MAVMASGAVLAACGSAATSSRPAAGHTASAATVPAAAVRRPPPATARRAARSHRAPAARPTRCRPGLPPEQTITRRRWLGGVIVTEYYPVPERWFAGRRVPAPGLGGLHRVDWLYSAHGLSMQGDGVDAAGRIAHIADLGSVGWVNAAGEPTVPPRCGIRWSRGAPFWRAGGWRNRAGGVTYPLAGGGWSDGVGHQRGDYGGATFSSGPSLSLRYYRSVAVDPRLIPRGSRIYIPAYRRVNGGWFVAQDTGGAIIGRHIDVYRAPTRVRFGSGRLLTGARVYVIPPGG
jgi:3D (Asp-Asp-Asp) domain-containing protein